VTVANLTNTGGSINGFLLGVGLAGNSGHGTINAMITNTTVDNLISTTSDVAAFGGFAFAYGAPSTVNMTVQDSTVTGIRGGVGSLGQDTTAFFAGGASFASSLATVNASIGNSLIADNLFNGTPRNCDSGNFDSLFSVSGPVSAGISSLGHNISDDASCSGFTQTGDQQNVSNIISTLGPLQNNGGTVPTRALLANSPAIAAGGHVLGVSTDARGIARPDSNPSVGAYQYVLADTTSGGSGAAAAKAPNTGIGAISPLNSAVVFSLFIIGSATALELSRRLRASHVPSSHR
jgi:hypothetical protein